MGVSVFGIHNPSPRGFHELWMFFRKKSAGSQKVQLLKIPRVQAPLHRPKQIVGDPERGGAKGGADDIHPERVLMASPRHLYAPVSLFMKANRNRRTIRIPRSWFTVMERKTWSRGGWEGGRRTGAVSESVAGAKERILTPETGECQSPPRASGLAPDLPKHSALLPPAPLDLMSLTFHNCPTFHAHRKLLFTLQNINLLMPLAGLSPGARLPDNNSAPPLIRAVARDHPDR
ncbi:hypothetical protein CDAR_250961 [Caerostris darwini]|uniref:Uncharacterized protein n=1 Tax=Caerostris darwini TaxID=1538125 RepID=A0AAV4TK76_9ARAC|nr:hypothetical protein CDAR_250961 [Caerostris darwini]